MPSFRHLLDAGVDPKESLQTFTIALPIFFLAARNGQLEAMRALVEKGMDPRFVGPRGITVVRQHQVLSALQRPDGGWGQMPTLSSDAYATGQALYALQVAGVDAADPVYRRGVDFLRRTQLEDGTWFVRTRAFGVQPYFETGFPHGPSQFISATATAWAAIALTHAVR